MYIISWSFSCQLQHPRVLRQKTCDWCFHEESPSKQLLLHMPPQPRWLRHTALESLRFANLPTHVQGQRCRLFLFVLLPETAHLAYDRRCLSSLLMTGRNVWSPKQPCCQLLSYTAPTLLRHPPLHKSHAMDCMRLQSITLSCWKPLLLLSFHFTDSISIFWFLILRLWASVGEKIGLAIVLWKLIAWSHMSGQRGILKFLIDLISTWELLVSLSPILLSLAS